MNETVGARATMSSGRRLDARVSVGLALALLFFILTGVLAYSNLQTLKSSNQQVVHTHEVLRALDDVLSTLKDAESGQRGYLLTGQDAYLEPYAAAVRTLEVGFARVKSLVEDNPLQRDRLPELRSYIDTKLAELQETINLQRSQGHEAALALVQTNRGKAAMDSIRNVIQAMDQEETRLRRARLVDMDRAYTTAILSGIVTCLLGIGLTVVIGILLYRAAQIRSRHDWLQAGRAGLSNAMLGDQTIFQLSQSILTFLARYFDAHAGAIFVREGTVYRRAATYGVPVNAPILESFREHEGLLGQVVAESQTIVIKDVPANYLSMGSALGQGAPKQLVMAPARIDGGINAVLELGFVHPLTDDMLTLLDQMADAIGLAVRSAKYRADLQNFLEETQRQAEELKSQGEELRVSNEELEEQSRALKESQTRLEQQQAELEQTNSQLEEQTRQLELQRDELAQANAAVQLKARELQQASQYKSDFLANMSHELRTPLNSLLILAKLLADNRDDNLTDEQVRFAQTIQSAGNDLLTLINDILDLSKIEAGHMEIRPETVVPARFAEDLGRLFTPLAEKKGLAFTISVAPECPTEIHTDRQRLEQVLKNLLANAVKFTESGSVGLSIRLAGNDRISFSVTDTGIGIAEDQQKAIFDAFRQADGTISRRYGGTGLGLSISRELARLLGGSIALSSKPGEGSTFTITIPQTYDPALVPERLRDAPAQPAPSAPTIPPPISPPAVPRAAPRLKLSDDRDQLSGSNRVLLVVEDDESFARILQDLSREMKFESLVAGTAQEALDLARKHVPHAIILDLGLPDHSGLSVLDQLKRDVRTRHIPVHIVSASENMQAALSLGAIGYLLKPTKLEDVTSALKKLEQKLDQRMRRLLIVEDDAVQRDAMSSLLRAHDVETVAVGTAADCLRELKQHTYDCMVLDLSLPDASGYSLLETLSQESAYSFPPVIVYTGRDLSADEEQQLRRYSKSIIIKGAKSPERLLDEVTLFLHQVVSELPAEQQKMIRSAHSRDAILEGRTILIVEDDVRNVYSLTNILEPRGASVQIARNGREAIEILDKTDHEATNGIDLVLMDVMMPVMDGLTATQQIRKDQRWKKLPIIMLTAKAMQDDQERCIQAGANDYMSKPLDVDKLLSLVRVWMPR